MQFALGLDFFLFVGIARLFNSSATKLPLISMKMIRVSEIGVLSRNKDCKGDQEVARLIREHLVLDVHFRAALILSGWMVDY